MATCDTILHGLRLLFGYASFQNAAAVTPHDTNDFAAPSSALYIGVAGDVKVDLEGSGEAIVFKAVPVGLLRIRATRVYSAGTTATNIVRLW